MKQTNLHPTGESRPLYEIAAEVRADWQRVHPWAAPYLQAMESLTAITDHYGLDGADDVVLRFLGNCSSWRGETARRVKNELLALLGLRR